MDRVKRYHVGDAGLVEGEALGRITVYLAADFNRVQAENKALQLLLDERDGKLDALAEPVPPAGGEVVVLPKRRVPPSLGPDFYARGWNAACDAWEPIVTRLQAEVEQWKANNMANALAAGELVKGLKAELTKARELLMEAHPYTSKSQDLFNRIEQHFAGIPSDE